MCGKLGNVDICPSRGSLGAEEASDTHTAVRPKNPSKGPIPLSGLLMRDENCYQHRFLLVAGRGKSVPKMAGSRLGM